MTLRKLTLLTPWSQTSSLQKFEKIRFLLFKPLSQFRNTQYILDTNLTSYWINFQKYQNSIVGRLILPVKISSLLSVVSIWLSLLNVLINMEQHVMCWKFLCIKLSSVVPRVYILYKCHLPFKMIQNNLFLLQLRKCSNMKRKMPITNGVYSKVMCSLRDLNAFIYIQDFRCERTDKIDFIFPWL